jgi:hypothetical protein
MPAHARVTRYRVALRRVALAASLALAAGGLGACSTLRATLHGYETGPNGIARPQQRLREALTAGDFVRALAWHDDDALLNRLTLATSAYYAGQYLRAGAILDTAALLADDRITERLSRDALALVTNDNARPYRPRRTERLFIPYYGMLSYVRVERWEDAAVEARRVVALLAQYDADRDADERPLHAALEHLAGAVLERAGQPGEAQVAYRVAHQLLEAVPERPATRAQGEGELVVVLERGFVAHRVTEQINVFIGDDEERARGTVAPAHASTVLGAGGTFASDSAKPPRRRRSRDDDDDNDYWLAVAFPSLRRSGRPSGEATEVRIESAAADAMRISSVIDEAASADERRDRVAMLARATARAGAKYALTKVVKDKKGELAGTLANYGASLLERADVRSWHLLPQEVLVFRTRLPAGTHLVRLEVADGATVRTVELGPVVVRAGSVTIEPFRIWRDRQPTVTLAKR